MPAEPASFLTGLYPNTIHVNRNGNAYFPANERVRLITRRLADRGYDCGLAGKLHVASCWTGAEPRVDDGYRVLHLSTSARCDPRICSVRCSPRTDRASEERVFERSTAPSCAMVMKPASKAASR